MKLHVFYAVVVCTLFFSCDDDDYPYSEVPSVVLNDFRAQFPNATEADFKRMDQYYEVEFEINNRDFGALIDPAGGVLKDRREVAWKELPPEVRDFLDREFGKSKVEDPEIIRAGDRTNYQVQIRGFWKDKKVVLDRTGKPDASQEYWN